MSYEITTTDLAKFGHREREMAAELLAALSTQGAPEHFDTAGVTVMMNMHSGYVFLTNEDFDVAMMNGDKLESFFTCPNCGSEGFADEIHEGEDQLELPADCWDYLCDIGAREAR